MRYIAIVLAMTLLSVMAYAQEHAEQPIKPDSIGLRNYAPKLYLDCDWGCDIPYIKSEIVFVNYVRERKEADVHLLVTIESTGGGGLEYALSFYGQRDYADLNYTLKYTANVDATEEETRSGLAKTIKRGLAPFISRTPLADYLSIEFEEKAEAKEVVDKWNNWVFEIGLEGWIFCTKTNLQQWYYADIEARRITEVQKLEIDGSFYYSDDLYRMEDSDVRNTSRSYNASILYAHGLSDHLSLGGWLTYNTDEYSNMKYGFGAAPMIEYNIFPYSEYAEHEFYFQYKLWSISNNYYEETIYEKLDETLFKESLKMGLSSTKKWGSVWASVGASNYLHDFSKNQLNINTGISWRVFSGFSLSLNGNYSMIHDQVALRREDATDEEILLRQRELETDYSFNMNLGLTYTFGSIYSNIVNPRF